MVHRAIDTLGPHDGEEVGQGLVIALLLEEQLSEGEAGPGEEHQVLLGDGGVDGVTERGLSQLGLAPGEELARTLEVFLDVHGRTPGSCEGGTTGATPR